VGAVARDRAARGERKLRQRKACPLALRSSKAVKIAQGILPMGKGAENMPKLLHARAPQDMAEEQKVRTLANSGHVPGDWINARSDDYPQLGWTSHQDDR
jgi:hypothetical protein